MPYTKMRKYLSSVVFKKWNYAYHFKKWNYAYHLKNQITFFF